MTFQVILSKIRFITEAHPLVRGMISYSILWPTSSLIQQILEGNNFETFNYKRCLRFALYGSFFVAPTLYAWVKISSVMWSQTNLRTGLIKAAVEQLSYGPFACASFFIGMSLLEGKTFKEGTIEMQEKFWPTYKVGLCVWPVLQTINYSCVPERNRVVYVSVCSIIWTTFLAYMKQRHNQNLKESNQIN